MPKEHMLKEIRLDDPRRFDKYQIMNGINRLSNLINSIHRDMEARSLLIISVLLTGVLGFLLFEGKFFISIIIGEALLILLLISLIKEAREVRILYNQSNKVNLSAKKLGLDLDITKTKI